MTSMAVMRSSDDSMSIYSAYEKENLRKLIQDDFINHKLIGINYSPKKSLFFRQGYGEVTSWYQDGTFRAQFGVEVTKLRPQGKNTHDDFHSIAKSVQVSLNSNEVNPIGAEAMLKIGVENVRRLYRVVRNPNKRFPDVSSQVLLLADGGSSPWSGVTAGTDELMHKYLLRRSESDTDYLYKI